MEGEEGVSGLLDVVCASRPWRWCHGRGRRGCGRGSQNPRRGPRRAGTRTERGRTRRRRAATWTAPPTGAGWAAGRPPGRRPPAVPAWPWAWAGSPCRTGCRGPPDSTLAAVASRRTAAAATDRSPRPGKNTFGQENVSAMSREVEKTRRGKSGDEAAKRSHLWEEEVEQIHAGVGEAAALVAPERRHGAPRLGAEERALGVAGSGWRGDSKGALHGGGEVTHAFSLSFWFFLVSRLDLEFIQTLQEQKHGKKWLATSAQLATKKKMRYFISRHARSEFEGDKTSQGQNFMRSIWWREAWWRIFPRKRWIFKRICARKHVIFTWDQCWEDLRPLVLQQNKYFRDFQQGAGALLANDEPVQEQEQISAIHQKGGNTGREGGREGTGRGCHVLPEAFASGFLSSPP